MSDVDLAAGSVFVAGHRGLVGSAIVRRLRQQGVDNLLLRTRDELDLTDQAAVAEFFALERPNYVFLAAAKVGGILANDTQPAEFLRDNLAIQTNVIHSAWKAGARKLCFLGSSCIYPRLAPQPLKEDSLLTGPLEPTNEWYAIAKIAGIKMCQAYRRQYGFDAISVMPTNLYGPGDNFDLTTSHVLPALVRKFHEAVESGAGSVTLWGTGTPRREFLHVDDMAAATVFLMQHYSDEQFVNVGSGEDLTITELAGLVARATGFQGRIEMDPSKPDGTPRKLMDVGRLRAMGWAPSISLEEGIERTVREYRAQAKAEA
jgi:GDP-L-fucose synthase